MRHRDPSRIVKHVPGELLRFHVQSSSRPDVKHLVDLEELDGMGWCGCEAFQWKVQTDRKAALKKDRISIRCRHIDAAREYFLNEVIAQMVGGRAAQPNRTKIKRNIKPISEARQAQLKVYERNRKRFLKAHPYCAVYPESLSEDVHHIRGRIGELLNDQQFWLPVSRDGHRWIDANRNEARKRGFLAAEGDWNKA